MGVTQRLYADLTQHSARDFPEGYPQLLSCVPERGFDDEVADEIDCRLANVAECNANNRRH